MNSKDCVYLSTFDYGINFGNLITGKTRTSKIFNRLRLRLPNEISAKFNHS